MIRFFFLGVVLMLCLKTVLEYILYIHTDTTAAGIEMVDKKWPCRLLDLSTVLSIPITRLEPIPLLKKSMITALSGLFGLWKGIFRCFCGDFFEFVGFFMCKKKTPLFLLLIREFFSPPVQAGSRGCAHYPHPK